jgi:hypothetical protein
MQRAGMKFEPPPVGTCRLVTHISHARTSPFPKEDNVFILPEIQAESPPPRNAHQSCRADPPDGDAAGALQLPVRPRTTMAELVAKENDAGAELNQEEPVDPKLRHCSAHIDRKRSEALFGHQHAPAIMPGTGVVREIFARAIQRERMQISVRALENEHIEICHGHHSRKGETARVGARLAQLASALREIGQPKHTARRCSTPSLSKLWDRLDETALIWCARWTRGRSKRVTTT